jgi:DNA-binding NarL/FixJ family response regulator
MNELNETKCEIEFNHSEPIAAERLISLWLVDDSDVFRELLAENFSYEKRRVHCARQFSSAEEVLAALETEKPPDVILMDVNMGGMKGTDAVALIKRIAPRTRVLMLTTFYDSHEALTAFRSGASGFLLKTYDFDRVMECVTSVRESWPDQWFRTKADSKPTPSNVPCRSENVPTIQSATFTTTLDWFARISRSVIAAFRRETSTSIAK